MQEISLTSIEATYKNKKTKEITTALSGFSFTFNKGIYAIVGPSGAGKSSLLKVIAGLIPYNGSLKFDGMESKDIPIYKRDIAYVSQDYIIYPHMSIFDNIAFPLKERGASKKEIIEAVNEIASILELDYLLPRMPKQLSGGQLQRVALARALVKRPSLFLFDEPLSNVSTSFREKTIKVILDEVNKTSSIALYVTHNINEAFEISSSIVLLDKGKLVFSGSKEDFKKSSLTLVRETLYSSYGNIF